MADRHHFGELGIGELRPGSLPRRWEPEEGVRKLNERIHKESKFADEHKKLPFSFRKPPKPISSPAVVQCENCGNISYATKATVGMVCSACKKFSKVKEV
jgi:formylmethanofuran dehydrogenase subunit E